MAQVPFVGDKMKEEDIYGAIRSAHDGHGVALPRWDDLDVSTRMAFIEAIAQAHSEGYSKGIESMRAFTNHAIEVAYHAALEDAARVAEKLIDDTSEYEGMIEHNACLTVAAAIRALKGNDNG